MRSPKVVTREECQALNKISAAHQKEILCRSEIKQLIITATNWRQEQVINSIFHKVLIKVSRGKYKFPETPIYIGKLQGIFDYISKQRKNQKRIVSATIVVNPVEEAIKLLKENGYKVTRQFFDMEKALQEPARPVSDFITIEKY